MNLPIKNPINKPIKSAIKITATLKALESSAETNGIVIKDIKTGIINNVNNLTFLRRNCNIITKKITRRNTGLLNILLSGIITVILFSSLFLSYCDLMLNILFK
jgi:hypothetical protein